MKAYWVRCGSNFGDVVTKYIVKKRYDVDLEWAPVNEASITSTGSLLELLNPDYSGVVLGSGAMWKDSKVSLPNAKIKLLRGKLTSQKLGGVYPLADPGLIVSDFAIEEVKEHNVGVIPHFVDKELQSQYSGHFISILSSPDVFISEVSKCKLVITSSLHALITADSLSIPRMWVNRKEVLGNGFKFHDYGSAINSTIIEGVVDMPNETAVAKAKNRVREAFDEVFE